MEISQQITAISPTNIKQDLFILHPPPKQVIEQNKKRISIIDDKESINDTDFKSQSNANHNNNNMLTLKKIQFDDLLEKKQNKQLFKSITQRTIECLPLPSNDKYPLELYNNITFDTRNIMEFDYNTNNMHHIDTPIYPNDYIYPLSLKDFVDRKFHLRGDIVKKWIHDRVYLIDKIKSNTNQTNNNNNDEKMDDGDGNNIIYRKFSIIDVRCDDFVGGNIPYCYNVSFEIFEDVINDLLLKFEHDSDIIFHCMYSQHRGPRCAYWYWKERRKWEIKYGDKLHKQRIWVLDGGFKQWISDNVYDEDLVCNFNCKYWDDEYFPLTGREFFYRNDWKPTDD